MKTCLRCRTDNANSANRCNACAAFLREKDTDFVYRWKCSKCKIINMSANEYCKCGNSRPGSCFLTTVICQELGKNDDCEELVSLRKFRDTYMNVIHPEMVLEYYDIAPSLVEKLEKHPRKREISQTSLVNFIHPALNAIQQNNEENALSIYSRMIESIKKELH